MENVFESFIEHKENLILEKLNAEVTQTKKGIKVALKGKDSEIATKTINMVTKAESELKLLNEEKKKITKKQNELKNIVAGGKDEIQEMMMEAASSIDSMQTIFMNTISATARISKHTAKNDPREEISYDAKALLEKVLDLVEGEDGLSDKLNELLSEVKTVETKVNTRALKIEGKVDESWLGDLTKWIKGKWNKFIGNFKKWFSKQERELNSINKEIDKL